MPDGNGLFENVNHPGSKRDSRGDRLMLTLLAIVVVVGFGFALTVTFDWIGTAIASAVVLVLWIEFRNRPRRNIAYAIEIASLLGFSIVACCFHPVSFQWVPGGRGTQCRDNLHMIGIALHNYHDAHGTFPPAVIADDHGRPMHSWRVLILPYIDQRLLYEQYDLNEPWDGPNNRLLLDKIPSVYVCPSGYGRDQHEKTTSYVAVTGLGAAWPGRSARSLEEFTDGTSKTIFIIETDADIPWMEPRDVDVDEAISILTSVENDPEHGHYQSGRFVENSYGRHFLMVDAVVRSTAQVTDPALYGPLLNIADGGPTDWEWRKQGIQRLRIGRCIALGAFIILALLPLAWIWRKPRNTL